MYVHSVSKSSLLSAQQSFVISAPLQRTHWQSRTYIAFSNTYLPELFIAKESFLHPSELETFLAIPFRKKKKQFLQGRYAAKLALSEHTEETDLRALETRSGIFQQPLAYHGTEPMPRISIAHTGDYAACVTFPLDHPMGLDIEQLPENMSHSISSELTAFERGLMHQVSDDPNLFYSRMWTAKEALGKALTTGLTIPLWIYEIETIEEGEGFSLSTFRHFLQYKALTMVIRQCVWAIAMPRNTDHLPIVRQLMRLNKGYPRV